MNTEEFCPPPLDLRVIKISNLAQLLHCPSDRLVLGKYRRLQIEACTQPRQRYRCRIPGQALYKGVECPGGLPSLQGINRLKLEKDFSVKLVQFKQAGDRPVTEQYPAQYRSRLTVPDG